MRRFVLVSHTIDPTGDWGLDDLAGSAGRIDVACRFLNSALFLSHGIRRDVEAYVCIVTDPDAPRTVRVRGASAMSFNPDERNLAAHLRRALQGADDDPFWQDAGHGMDVAALGLEDLLDGLPADVAGPVFLDPTGTPIEDAPLGADATFFLSDHRPFTEDEAALLDGRHAARISLGDAWYHGDHVVSVVQHRLDRIHGASIVGREAMA